MISAWPEMELGSVLEMLIDHRGKTPKKMGGDDFTDSGVPVVSAIHIKNGRIEWGERERFVPQWMFEKWMPNRVRKGDVLVTSEAPMGQVAQVSSDDDLVISQRLFALRGMREVLDSTFLRYFLQTDIAQRRLEGRSSGTTVTGIRQAELVRMQVPVPDFAEQRAIAEVLGALDDKIAANTRLATTADALVRAMYARLCDTADEWSTLGDVAQSLRDLVEPSSAQGRYVGLEHIPRRSMWLDTYGDVDEVTSTKTEFAAGDVLFGKLRPYFHKVVSAPWEGVASTDILVLRPTASDLAGFVLAAAASDEAVAAANAASEGTRMPRAKWADLASVEVPAPSSEVRQFSASVDTIRAAVESTLAENRALAATRDALLPALMSGRLRVRDAGRIVEGGVVAEEPA